MVSLSDYLDISGFTGNPDGIFSFKKQNSTPVFVVFEGNSFDGTFFTHAHSERSLDAIFE